MANPLLPLFGHPPNFFLPRANSALGKALPSAREIALGKGGFAESLVAV